jgi:hypothetical protein
MKRLLSKDISGFQPTLSGLFDCEEVMSLSWLVAKHALCGPAQWPTPGKVSIRARPHRGGERNMTDIARFSLPALANQANRPAIRLRLLERVPPFN